MRRLFDFVRDTRGATAIEYGLICALIFLAIVGGAGNFGRSLSNMLTNVSTAAGDKL